MFVAILLAISWCPPAPAAGADWGPAIPEHWIATDINLGNYLEAIEPLANTESSTVFEIPSRQLVLASLMRIGATCPEFASLAVIDPSSTEWLIRSVPSKVERLGILATSGIGCDGLDVRVTNEPEMELQCYASNSDAWIMDRRTQYPVDGGNSYLAEVHLVHFIHGRLWCVTRYVDAGGRETDRFGLVAKWGVTSTLRWGAGGVPEAVRTSVNQGYDCSGGNGGPYESWFEVRRLISSSRTIERTERRGYGTLIFPYEDRLTGDPLPGRFVEKSWLVRGERYGTLKRGEAVHVLGFVTSHGALRVVSSQSGVTGFVPRGHLNLACQQEQLLCGDDSLPCPHD